MPDPALPIPRRQAAPGTQHYRWEYVDGIDRPLTGKVVIAPQHGDTDFGARTIVGAPFTVEIPTGVLEVDLPPGTYSLTAQLLTPEGKRVTVASEITL